jgi:hypothetical protein
LGQWFAPGTKKSRKSDTNEQTYFWQKTLFFSDEKFEICCSKVENNKLSDLFCYFLGRGVDAA